MVRGREASGAPRKVPLRTLNERLTCSLCRGYFIDATTITECLHTFCRSCIVAYLETHKYCPVCDVLVHKTKPLTNIRPDKTMQDVVYKLVPRLYRDEMLRRRNFYVARPEAAPSKLEQKTELAYGYVLSPEDNVCVSLRYVESRAVPRYLKCPAAVTIAHLQRLVSGKFNLSNRHHVDIYHGDDCLRSHLSLMEVAYIYNWRRMGPLELTYRIFENCPSKRVKLNEEEDAETAAINNNNNWKEVQLRISENGEMSVVEESSEEATPKILSENVKVKAKLKSGPLKTRRNHKNNNNSAKAVVLETKSPPAAEPSPKSKSEERVESVEAVEEKSSLNEEKAKEKEKVNSKIVTKENGNKTSQSSSLDTGQKSKGESSPKARKVKGKTRSETAETVKKEISSEENFTSRVDNLLKGKSSKSEVCNKEESKEDKTIKDNKKEEEKVKSEEKKEIDENKNVNSNPPEKEPDEKSAKGSENVVKEEAVKSVDEVKKSEVENGTKENASEPVKPETKSKIDEGEAKKTDISEPVPKAQTPLAPPSVIAKKNVFPISHSAAKRKSSDAGSDSEPPPKQPTILNHTLGLQNLSNNHPLKKHSMAAAMAPPCYSPVINVPRPQPSTRPSPSPTILNSKVPIKNKSGAPMGYKTLRDPPKSWNPQIPRPIGTRNSDNGELKNVRPPKFFKIRNNMPRYLGNPSSGVKPMYQLQSPEKDKGSNDNIKKHSIVKIDPKTLKPISERAPETSDLTVKSESSHSDLKINTSSVSIFNPLKLQTSSSKSNDRKSPKSPNKVLNFTPPNPFVPNLQSPTVSPNQFLFPGPPPPFNSYLYHSFLYNQPRLPPPSFVNHLNQIKNYPSTSQSSSVSNSKASSVAVAAPSAKKPREKSEKSLQNAVEKLTQSKLLLKEKEKGGDEGGAESKAHHHEETVKGGDSETKDKKDDGPIVSSVK